ncbi:serine/threonine-protein kinase [Rheinheimera riviphila]|uniref:Serine/threonine-protein kinase n=1 Tax=Rheinheimera riviphila TaxID=1834037 RepID=A0A437R500_9GAMM|nr:serine/threonine-protein kinase [Rheinheimera riviphila]
MQCSQCFSENSPLDVHCQQCGQPLAIDLAASATVKPFAPYQLLEKAGEGGMGVVYRAYDASLCRFVAIKVLRVTGALQQQQTQLEEARLLSSLQHPNIVTVYDISRYGEQQYIVTEWLEGQTLEQLLVVGQPALPDLLDMVIQMAQGIDCAHQAGVIHRDLKPSNVMVLSKHQQIKLLDFGMASRQSLPQLSATAAISSIKTATGADWSQHTTQGALKGTLPYLAPELTEVNAQASVQSDIFSFGVMLYQLCFGVHPFLQATAAQTLQAINDHREVQLPPSSLPPALLKLIRHCLAAVPAARPASMQQVLQVLQPLQRDISQRARLGWLYPLTRKAVWVPLLILTLAGSLYLGKSSVGRDDVLGDGQTLALLPFENIGADPALDGFIKGLSLSLSHDLSLLGEQNQDYWVIPAAEISQLQQPSVADLHRQFAVDLVLQGSMQHLGATRRLRLALVNASNNRVIRSTELDLTLNGWDQAQQQIRTAVLGLLQWQLPDKLTSQLSRGSATDDRAYQHYLTGLSLLYRFDYQENLEKAVQELQTAVQLNPDFKAAWVELNRAYLKIARLRDFERWFELAVKTSDDLARKFGEDADVLQLLAEIQSQKADHKAAIALYLKALEVSEGNSLLWHGLARVYEAIGDLQQAEYAFAKARDMQKNWFNLNALATFYYRTGQLIKAIESFKELSLLSPENDQILQTLGAVQFAQADVAGALDTFKKALKMAPNGNNYSNVATALFYQKKYAESVEFFEQAVALNPKQLLFWANLADGYRWAGQHEKSVHSYQQAINLIQQRLKTSPESLRLQSRLALYQAKSANCQSAVSFLNSAIAYPDNSVVIMAAQIAEICQQRAKAIDLIKKAMSAGYSTHSIQEEPEFEVLLRQEPDLLNATSGS